MQLDVKLKGQANEDLIQGYPGVPATWPRLAGTVEVRSLPQGKDGAQALDILAVSIALFRTDSIVIPSHRPTVAAHKREKSFLVTRQKEIYRKANAPESGALFALDVPFTLSFPTNKAPTASISLAKTLDSTYNAIVGIELMSPVTNQPVITNYQFPVRVKRFDTLRTFGTYKQPIFGEQPSSDHLVSLEWSLPVSAYGPGDQITISLKAQANRDWPRAKKVKLKRFSVELLQKTRYIVDRPTNEGTGDPGNVAATANATSSSASSHTQEDDDIIDTRTRIVKTARDFASPEQDARVGMESSITLDLMVPSAIQSEERDGILPKEQPWVGYSGRTAFTNASSLYHIEFSLVIKARFSHAKDIEAEQSITLSQFDHYACMSYMNSLVEAAQRLKHLDLRPHPPRAWNEALDTKIRIV